MFGMGTGGSLRLLSPETKQGLVPFAAAFLLTSDRPSNGLPTSFERLSLPPSFSRQSAIELPPGFPLRLQLPSFGLRTLKTAQVGLSLARPRPHSILAFSHKPFLRFRFGFRFRFPSLRSRFGSFSYSLLPFHYSLLSKIKPSTD